MITHSSGIAVHRTHATVRRVAAVLLATLVVGAPFVAGAMPSERPSESSSATSDAGSLAATITPPAVAIPFYIAAVEAPPAPEVDPVMFVLVDTYELDEQGPRVEALQAALGVAVDGRYGLATQRAHRGVSEFLGLPPEDLPVSALPPGTTESQWAALRDCESNGNYSIVSSSGAYRGAYQFNRSTWDSVAERNAPILVGVDPAEASPADQDAMAFALYGERGSQPWPSCGRFLP